MHQHEIKAAVVSECAGGVLPPQTCTPALFTRTRHPSQPALQDRWAEPSPGFALRPRPVRSVAVPSLTWASVKAQDKWGCSFGSRLISKSVAKIRECPWQVRTDRREADASPAVCVCVFDLNYSSAANEEEVWAFTLDWIELVQTHSNCDLTSLACSRCSLTNSSTNCMSSQRPVTKQFLFSVCVDASLWLCMTE